MFTPKLESMRVPRHCYGFKEFAINLPSVDKLLERMLIESSNGLHLRERR